MTGEALLLRSNGEWLPLGPFAGESDPGLRRSISQPALIEQGDGRSGCLCAQIAVFLPSQLRTNGSCGPFSELDDKTLVFLNPTERK